MEDCKNSEITKSNENSYEMNGVVQFFLVGALFFNVLAAVGIGYDLLQNPIENTVKEILLCLQAFLIFRVLDTCRWALFTMFGLMLIYMTITIITYGFGSDFYKILATFVFWTLMFFLPKNGRTSWCIILESPQTKKIEKKDRYALIVIYCVIVIAIIAGIVKNAIFA